MGVTDMKKERILLAALLCVCALLTACQKQPQPEPPEQPQPEPAQTEDPAAEQLERFYALAALPEEELRKALTETGRDMTGAASGENLTAQFFAAPFPTLEDCALESAEVRPERGVMTMRTLRDEVLNRGIPVVDFTSAIELIKDENGHCAGAILLNMETKELMVAKAKTVILATGGAGRLHYQGFPTSNHYGATADGLVLGYRAGAKLLYPDTLQYHPTGAAYPAQIYGALVTEKVRSVGAMLVNADGEVFMNPLETRDVSAASIIRECTERGKGVKTPAGQAVWLDTPMIELKNGAGTIEKRIPAMMRMFAKHGIDIRKEPILVYPTLHYQNGGLHITPDGQTDVENLFAAGEVVGGIHGRNRLMGNSLLDVIVFGRNAGQHAAEKAKSVTVGALTLDHVAAFEAEKQQAGVTDHRLSPQLLPDYARKIHPAEK